MRKCVHVCVRERERKREKERETERDRDRGGEKERDREIKGGRERDSLFLSPSVSVSLCLSLFKSKRRLEWVNVVVLSCWTPTNCLICLWRERGRGRGRGGRGRGRRSELSLNFLTVILLKCSSLWVCYGFVFSRPFSYYHINRRLTQHVLRAYRWLYEEPVPTSLPFSTSCPSISQRGTYMERTFSSTVVVNEMWLTVVVPFSG